jgi:hypothetical protein
MTSGDCAVSLVVAKLAAVGHALNGSRLWHKTFPFAGSWFENDAATEAAIGSANPGARLSRRRRMVVRATETAVNSLAACNSTYIWIEPGNRADGGTEDQRERCEKS